ncbi:glycosyltransferase family 2 protein [Selenomonas sputigena]|uniref:Glycosyltransferase family 2 protein n=1 Tax=Selenomonas sputigena TaxID=69823 RepID=A0ABV3X3N3_9FIRM
MKNKLNELVSTMRELALYASSLPQEKEKEIAAAAQDIATAAGHIREHLSCLQEDATLSGRYLENIVASAGRIGNDVSRYATRMAFELVPFISELCRFLPVELGMLDWEKYTRRREEASHRLENFYVREPRFRVSIILTAFNKLEYTKIAVENIYRHTDFERLGVELITVNNGSSDGTAEYFASLPNEKKMDLAVNIPGQQCCHYLAEGKYTVGFANDVVATSRWLDNLLACIESDERIFWVVPTCNADGISNNQGTEVSYQNTFRDMDKMQVFAAQHNHADPSKWEDFSLLMPFLSIYRTLRQQEFSLCDLRYAKELLFIDDDLSTMLRRTGYRQVLARDTFMHHFGSVTLDENRAVYEEKMEEMRKVYQKKWGVDAWDSRKYFRCFEEILPPISAGEKTSCLVLEPLFCISMFRVLNHFRRQGAAGARFVAAGIDRRYEPDAKPFFDVCVFRDSWSEVLAEIEGEFSLIISGCLLNDMFLGHIEPFLERLYDHLAPGGHIILPVSNRRSAGFLQSLLRYEGEPSAEHTAFEFMGFSPTRLKQQLKKNEKLCHSNIVRIQEDDPSQVKFVERLLELVNEEIHPLTEERMEALRSDLQVQLFYLIVWRQAED